MAKKQKSPVGLSRGKIILIGGLVMLLYLVIMAQLPGKPTPPPSKAESRPATKNPVAKQDVTEKPPINPVVAEETIDHLPKPIVWAKVGLADAIAHNPFVMPAVLKPKPQPVEQTGDKQISPAEVARRARVKQEAIEREAQRLREAEQEKRIAEQRVAYERGVASERKRIEQLIASIQEKGFDMVFSNSRTKLVKRGEQFLQENDEFEGLKIVEIRDDGRVILESAYQPKPFSPSVDN